MGTLLANAARLKTKNGQIVVLPRSKANSLSKSERAATARKKKREGAKGKQVVSNTKAAKVRKAAKGGEIRKNHRGCGAVMPERRKED